MNVDYYALLTKAVAGKDAAARDQIYRDAYGLIRKSSHLTREDALSHAAALEDAIRQIERRALPPKKRGPRPKSTRCCRPDRNWKPLVFGAAAVVAVIAVSALLYGYIATKGPGSRRRRDGVIVKAAARTRKMSSWRT